jgi:hypothetical protein
MQWLKDPNQSSVDNLNNVRLEVSRHFRNKMNEYLKVKIDEHETNSKIKNIRDLCRVISDFQTGYQSKSNIVKDEKGDLVTDCHIILARWGKNFSLLFDAHGVSDVRPTYIQQNH